jgi:Uncharacterised nucleotidyltransferase
MGRTEPRERAIVVEGSSGSTVWDGVDYLVDRCVDLRDLRAHRLHLFAARRWRTQGLALPAGLEAEAQRAALLSLMIPLALERIRAVAEGPILILKGAEIASRYPDPALRPMLDIDLLAPEPDDVQRRLIAAGFVAIGMDDDYYSKLHHLRPLYSPEFGVKVEIHRRPQWVLGSASPPGADELFQLAGPASVGVEGISSLPPPQHALLVAAHSWSELPLRRILDLIDLEALMVGVDRRLMDKLADGWDLSGVWGTLIAAADSMLLGKPPPWALRTWASDVRGIREPTVLGAHVHRVAGPVWAFPPSRAVGATLGVLAREVRPAAGETWRQKLSRTRLALRDHGLVRSEHDRRLPPS